MQSDDGRKASAFDAAELDACDPLRAFRDRFLDSDEHPVLSYLDGNSLGRPLAETPGRIAEFIAEEWGGRLIRAWDEKWMDAPTRLGDRLAELVLGAGPGQTVIADSTSVLLYKLLRLALDARPGRNQIVLDRDNFPSDRFIVEGVAAETGAEIVWIEPDEIDGVSVADVRTAVGESTAVVLLSHVSYRSGAMADGPGITAAAHAAGALMLWDLCHSAGAVPVDLDDWGADLAAGCTYKYLNGGPGAPAFAYVNRDLQGDARQPIWGWMGAADPFGMTAEYAPAGSIRQVISGTPPILAMQPLSHMLDLIDEVGGIDPIRKKSTLLTERAIHLFDTLLADEGVELASPRDSDRRGSHVTMNHPRFREATAALWERGVIPDFRPPRGLRVGLSPLSTSFAEVDAGMRAIRERLEDDHASTSHNLSKH